MCILQLLSQGLHPAEDGRHEEPGSRDDGLEAPAWRGGTANGKFLAALLDPRGTSYRDLLLAARDSEALRVVDGELDNEYRPERFRISLTNR